MRNTTINTFTENYYLIVGAQNNPNFKLSQRRYTSLSDTLLNSKFGDVQGYENVLHRYCYWQSRTVETNELHNK